ncbi:MAG: hypothetical protein IPK66_05515 [Rhodospirillales bacterium]|nr:hypothetical protein [Rhodospirillales bacterium]
MTISELPYDLWLEEALRSVIRNALLYTAEHGLPGSHHFYLTFVTGAPGVEIAPELRAKHPEEMTIVLQHQFWDLLVDDLGFEVTLKFHGRSSRLVIPYAAITAFGDPSVSFGLQLKTLFGDLAEDRPAEDAASAESQDTSAPQADEKPATGEVIALDTFRKK